MRPISLLYHDVVNGDPATTGFTGSDADSYKLDEANFRAHLEAVAAAGASRVRVVEPSLKIEEGSIDPIFLTFDDGGASAHTPTAALLEAHGWRGHFFVVTARIDQPGFLTREQIRDLHRRGHHIGSHSHTHPRQFSKLSYEHMLDEWRTSRRILADILGQAPLSISVPGGFYSPEVARSAKEAGYRLIFNSEPSSRTRRQNGLIVLGRYGVKRETTPNAAQALARGDFSPRARQMIAWNIKKPLKKAGGPIWFWIRRWRFERKGRR